MNLLKIFIGHSPKKAAVALIKIVNDEIYLEENTSAARSVVGENNNIFR
jgi:hypothetical protein